MDPINASNSDDAIQALYELGNLGYDHDGHEGLSMRPDALQFIIDAMKLRPPAFHTGGATVAVSLRSDGAIKLHYHPKESTGRSVSLAVVDGETITFSKFMQGGGRVTGLVRRTYGEHPPAAFRSHLDDLFRWMNREDG